MANYLFIGGSTGIGLEMITRLQADGHQVTVLSRSEPPLSGITHHFHDILEEEIPDSFIPAVLDGLVYCPGTINLKPFRSLKLTDFRHDLEVNLLGAVKALQATQKALKKSEHPAVVLFSTVAAGRGMAFHASVAASKAAVEGLTRSLAAEWAPKVRLNCIAPSLTDTPLAEKLLATDEKRKNGADRHPLKRLGTPGDMAALALFLLSPASSWITGQVIGVDGGLSTLG